MFMKILHLTEKIYTSTACGACDKYEVTSLRYDPALWRGLSETLKKLRLELTKGHQHHYLEALAP